MPRFAVHLRYRSSVAILVLSGVIGMLGGCDSQSTPKAPTAKTYSFWPPAPDEPRVQFLVSFNSSADVTQQKSKFDEMLYGKGTEVGIVKPYGVAMWNGRIYVSDTQSRGVMVWDLRKRQARVMGASGAGEIQRPIDISIGPDGSKYVVDGNRNAIVVFDPDERYVTTYTLKDFNPVSVAAHGKELFVCDFAGACVKVLDISTGRYLRTIGSPTPKTEAERPQSGIPIYRRGITPTATPDDGYFVRPLSVRVDSAGNVFVADILKCRVQKFSSEGELLLAFGGTGDRIGEFIRPKHMGVAKTGDIYVVDGAFNNVQVFDDEGRVVGFFGAAGTHPGAMDLPVGLGIDDADLDLFQQYLHPAFEAERLIVVTNQFGPNKVSVYAQGHLKPGKTVADVSAGRAKVNLGLEENKAPTSQPADMGTPVPPEIMQPSTLPSERPPAP